ncbi:MAG TPA: CDP-diacylglycerol--glycerol-3-phosphate 3-phosphatidyltransferase [Verrucomicrobiae bacterium]
MNLPNKLTLSRMVMTLAFLIVVFSHMRWYQTIALVIFSIASLTDYFDGKIAREKKLITNFGILMDPLADKILVCSAFIAFVELQWMAAWMVVVVVARELTITGLRLLAASKNVVMAAERYGKHKTISQIVAVIAILIFHAHDSWGVIGEFFSFNLLGFGPWIQWFSTLAKWVAVILTFYSGSVYLWKNRELLLKDM